MTASHINKLQAALEDTVAQTTSDNPDLTTEASVAPPEEPTTDASAQETPGPRRSQRSQTRTPLGRNYDVSWQVSREKGARVRQGRRRSMSRSRHSEADSTTADHSQYETVSELDREQLINELSEAVGTDCHGKPDQELFNLYNAIQELRAQQKAASVVPKDTETTFVNTRPLAVGRGFFLDDPLLKASFPVQTSSKPASRRPSSKIAAQQENDTQTEPSDDNEDLAFPTKHSRTSQLPQSPSTPGGADNPNTPTESESESVHAPPESLQLRPRKNGGLSSSQVPTRKLTEETEVVPETDAEILAERAPRYNNPRTYNNARSHANPMFQIEESPWQNRLHAEAPNHRYSSAAHSTLPQPSQPNNRPFNSSRPYDTLNERNEWRNDISTPPPIHRRSQAPSADRKTDTAIRREDAKRRLSHAVDPLQPVVDAGHDRAATARNRLDGMASTMMGRRDQPRESGHRHTTRPNAARARANSSANAQLSEEEDQTGMDNEDEVDEGNKEGPGETGMTGTARKRKPRTNQLKGPARHVIVIAKLLMWIYILMYGPFLARETYLLWAPIVYEIAWYHVYPNRRYTAPEDIAYPIMVDNLASLKLNAKLICRPIIEFLVKLRNPVLTQDDLDWNLDIIRWIYPLRFHCTNPRRRRGHYDSVIIPRILSAILFGGENSVGIVFHELLDPLPIPTLAFVLTMIQFCLSEWKTGVYKPRDLKLGGETGLLKMFDTHMKNIKNYETVAKPHLNDLRKDWIDYAVIYSGASLQGDQDLVDLIDANEFRQGLADAQSSRHGTHGRKRQRTESTEQEIEPESSRGPRRRVESSLDEEIAHALYEADIEAEQEDELEDDNAMDIDIQHSAARELSYEFPDPSPPTQQLQMDTPPEVNEEGRYTASAKGKGRME